MDDEDTDLVKKEMKKNWSYLVLKHCRLPNQEKKSQEKIQATAPSFGPGTGNTNQLVLTVKNFKTFQETNAMLSPTPTNYFCLRFCWVCDFLLGVQD